MGRDPSSSCAGAMQRMLHLLLLLEVQDTAGFGSAANLNNPSYTIANPLPNPPNGNFFKGVYSTAYPGEQVPEYFDVWSPPVSTLYSQVFWAMLPPVPLPENVVKKFDNETMVITESSAPLKGVLFCAFPRHAALLVTETDASFRSYA